ncbi:MAG: glycosyltransferase family 4 protein [Candidatus Anstonellales archaeon]
MIKPKVLVVCNSFPPAISGVGQYVYNFVNKLTERYEFTILTTDIVSLCGLKSIKRTREYCQGHLKNRVIRVPCLPPYAPYLLTYPLTFVGSNIIKKENYSLVHLHSLGQIHSDTLTILSKKRNLPVVYSIHGWRNVENLFVNPLLFIYESTIVSKILKFADVITVLGSRSLKYISSLLRVSSRHSKIEIVPNGINFYDIRRILNKSKEKNLLNEVENNILFVGRLSRMKGIYELLRAFTIVQRFNDCRLTIVGDGPLKDTIINFVQKYGRLKKSINFIGPVLNRSSLYKLFYNSKVLVLPSYSEGMPTVILEAMSIGVPVIATDVGDIVDIIMHGENGLLVRPGDIKDLAKKILMMIEDGNLRRKFIKNGLKTAQKYDWSIISKKIDKIYRALI